MQPLCLVPVIYTLSWNYCVHLSTCPRESVRLPLIARSGSPNKRDKKNEILNRHEICRQFRPGSIIHRGTRPYCFIPRSMPHTRNEVIIAVNPYIVYLSAIKCNCGSNIFMSAMQHCHYYCSRAGHQLRKGSLSHLWPWQATDHPDGKRFNSSLGMVVILLCFVLGDTNIRVVEATRVSTGLSLPPNGGHLLANRCWFPDPRNAGEVRRVIRWASCSIFDVQCNSVLFTMIKSERHVRGGSLRSARAHPDNRAPVPFSATTPTSTEYISSPTGTAAKLDALVQATDKGSQNILYFAYGANMNPSVLTGKRGVTPLASLPAQAIAFADNGNGKRPRGSIGHGGGRHPGMCLCFCHRAGGCEHECLQRASLKCPS